MGKKERRYTMYITGGVVNKDNPLYFESTRDFNLAHRKFPCIMVFCFSEDDVINALKYAVSEDIHFRVRSGRNDYEGNSNVEKTKKNNKKKKKIKLKNK